MQGAGLSEQCLNELNAFALVSGRPGSGKTTLATRLASVLGCPLVSRDTVFEGMALNSVGDLHKTQVASAFVTFFEMITLLAQQRVFFVAEAAFQNDRWIRGLGILIERADIRHVHCDLNAETARARVAARHATQMDVAKRRSRLWAHDPLKLPVGALMIDTSSDYDPTFEVILEFITTGRRAMRGSG